MDDLHRPQFAHLIDINGQNQTIHIPFEHDIFFSQIKQFTELYLTGKSQSSIMPLTDSLACAQILDQIKAKI